MSEGPPAVRSLVEHLGEELVELGLSSPRIIALPGSALPDSPSVFLLASGRAARAVLHWSPAGSGDVVARGTRRAEGAIEGWLEAHDDIDAVIWIARDPRNEKRAAIWSVPSPRLDDGALDTLVDVLSGGRD